MSAGSLAGDIAGYLAALDHGWDDPEVQAVVERLGPAEAEETSTPAGVPVRTVTFEPGVIMEWRSDRLASIVFTGHDGRSDLPGGGSIRSFGRPPRTPYVWFDDLIDGVGRGSTREDVRLVLGEPLRSWYAYDEYLVDGRVLSALFYGTDFKEIKLLAEDPIVLSYPIPWSPIVKRRDGQFYLEVPVSLGAADTIYQFPITERHVEALSDPERFEQLCQWLRGMSDKDAIRTIIDEVCR